MKKILLLLIVLCFNTPNVLAQTQLRFGNDLTSSFPSYTFTSTDVYYRDLMGTNLSNSTTSLCAGALRRTQTASSILYLEVKSSSISQLVVHLTSNGTGNRTLTGIATASTLTGTYTNVTGSSSVSTLATGSITSTTCGTVTISDLSIPQNTFIRLTFNGNANISGFDIFPIAAVSEPTTQASNISFSNVLSSSFTSSWTNGNGSNRVVFVKAGAQGTIDLPVDGTAYTANADWNNGTPSGSQLGTSGYYCVYNGNGSTVNLVNLIPNTVYWVQIFEYNGTGSGANYLTTTATNNPNSQATNAAATQYFFRTIASGNWGDLSTWEQSTDNSTWTSASASPNFDNSQSILILDNHEVTLVSGNETIDQTTIQGLGKVIIASGATLTVNNGAGDDIIVNGTLELNGTLASNASSLIRINGVFENKLNAASFSPGSGNMIVEAGGTYRINGYTGTASYVLSNVTLTQGIGVLGSNYEVLTGAPRLNNTQSYGNVIWNSNLVGGSFLNNPSVNVTGNFTLLASPGINHGSGGSGRALTIAGNLTISGGKYEISGNGAVAANTLNVNGTITLNGGELILSNAPSAAGIGTLNAAGTITLNAGIFGVPTGITNGNVVLNGTASQSISVADGVVAKVQNFTINTNSGINFTGASTFDVQGNVIFDNVNNASVNAGGVLRLLSTATSTAMITDVTNNGVNSGNTITGNVVAQRFIPQGKRAFRFVTPGVTTTDFILNNWQEATHITGSSTGANGFDATSTGNPSMFTYNNQASSGTGWIPIANTNATNLVAGHGYRLLIRGDRNVNLNAASEENMNTAVLLEAKGSILSGTVTYNATSSPAINNTTNTTTADYSLVGNPYLSSVDWHQVTKSGLENVYYAWDANLGSGLQRGRYVAYSQATESSSIINGSGTTNVGRYIQSGQAFFVKNTTSGIAGSLTFNENNKVANHLMLFRNTNTNSSQNIGKIYTTLYETDQLNNGFAVDGALAVISSDFANQSESIHVKKLEAPGINVMFFRNNSKLAIEATDIPESTDELQMLTTNLEANKNYSWKFTVDNLPSGVTPYLQDLFTNVISEINNPNLVVNFQTSNDAGSVNNQRFKIIFTNTPLSVSTVDLKNITLYPNPSSMDGIYMSGLNNDIQKIDVKVYNAIGQEIPIQISNQGNGSIKLTPKANTLSGIYFIKVSSGEASNTIKWILK